MGAGSVAMALLVGANRELADMGVERALGKIETDMAAAGTTLLGFDQRQVDRVGDKVGF